MVNAMRFAAQLRNHFLALAIVCAAWCAPQTVQAQDVPDATIPLESLGYQPAPAHILLAEGYTVSSLQYVDAQHILFTYNKRSLIKRMPGDSPDESPQNMAAVLLESPSGKVLAQTEWRLPDHSQYLWPIGEGTFLLRIGRELRLLTPLAASSDPGTALHGKMLMTLPGRASLIAAAPDGRMLMVESDVSGRYAAAAAVPSASNATTSTSSGSTSPDAQPDPAENHTTDVQFLEFDLARQAQGIVNVNLVGHLTAPSMLALPLTHDGYMHATEIYPGDWGLIYTELNGEDTILGDVVSTCRPSAAFLSNSEALVETCNGNDTAVIMTVVTLGKKELWQQALDDAGTDPEIRTTPASGRFAVSRILLDGVNSPGVDVVDEDDVRKQHIDVMDIRSGALVMSVDVKPAERSAQNFSLSPDGRHMAVLQGDAIAIYDLAPIQDFPPAPIKPKDLVFVAAPEGAVAASAPVKTTAAAPVTAAAPAVMAPPAVIEVPLNVDAQRVPPTLLTPDEQKSVEGKKNKEIIIQPIDPPPPPPKQPKGQQQPN